jgi:O-6-methylguanine DNA methyltransferase
MTARTSWAQIESPLGRFAVGADDVAVTAVLLPDQLDRAIDQTKASSLVLEAAHQLEEYLVGRRRSFDLPLASTGTPFQEEVWLALREVPYGTVQTYRSMALRLDRPKAARAVGQALGKNPIPILRPCHRIVAAEGLGGFAGGLGLKRALLELERSPEPSGSGSAP